MFGFGDAGRTERSVEGEGTRTRTRHAGRFVVASILATAVVSASAVFAQPRITIPKGPVTAPTIAPTALQPTATPPPAPPSGPIVMPTNPIAPGTTLKANPFQTKKPLIAPARPTPAVAMVAARQAKHAAFDQRGTLRPVPRRSTGAVNLPPLPATLGAGGPALRLGTQVIVDTDGRKVPAQVYQADTYTVEDYLNGRGITQRTKEGTNRSTRDMKRQIARAQLPPGDATQLRPTNVPALRGKPAVLPIARAQTLAQASASLWESGDTVTLDEYPSKNEQRRPPPIRQFPPPPPPEEIDRPEAATNWFYKSGGEVGLDIDANAVFSAGKSRRKARATMGIRGYVAGIEFPLFATEAEIQNEADHVFNPTTKSFSKGAGGHTKSGALTIMGIGAPVFPKLEGFDSPPSWVKSDGWSVSAAVPVGPFLAEFGFSMGYEVGGNAKLAIDPDGLGVSAQVGPRFGAYGELTAGIGVAGFSVGVGGHVAILGNKDASGAASFTRKSVSRYEESGGKQRMTASIDSDVWALSGYLFAFIDTWWDRYDTELFDWDGIKLGGADVASGTTDILWGTFQEPDYGPLREFRAFACRTKTAKTAHNFPHDWVTTTRTKAEMIAGGCELAPGQNEVYLGKLASKWNPDTVPLAECRAETTWIENPIGIGTIAPNVPVTQGVPFITNEYVKALWKDWKTAPTDAELAAEGKAECENVRVGNGQRLTLVRIGGYAWKTQGDIILDWKTRATTSTIEVHRCSGNGYDWWLQTNKAVCPGGYPNGPKNFSIAKP